MVVIKCGVVTNDKTRDNRTLKLKVIQIVDLKVLLLNSEQRKTSWTELSRRHLFR